MNNSQHREIISRLQSKTDSGQLKWEGTTLSTKYRVSLKGYDITVMAIENDGSLGNALISVKAAVDFIDSHGSVFDSYKAYEFSDPEYREISRLFVSARRSALGLDRKLSDILGQLE
ncbi:MAG: hypothetical protein K2H03_00580 [Muribaculaceae bacterium]|nr:hypothetical protein [Muribaculaceae bacterium]